MCVNACNAYTCAASAQCPQEKNILIYKRKSLEVQCLQEELVWCSGYYLILILFQTIELTYFNFGFLLPTLEVAIRFWSSLLSLLFGWIFSPLSSSHGASTLVLNSVLAASSLKASFYNA